MNLIIEQGNSTTKVALFDNGRLITSSAHHDFDVSMIISLFQQHELTHGIMSTVTETDQELLGLLEGRLERFIFMTEHTPLPIRVCYETPATLGKDRLAAVVGANFLEPEKNILIIDAGTAITYEVIEAPDRYVGGNISPGMTTRFRALNHFTSRLPLVHETDEVPLLGSNTATAIRAGVVNGICYEIDGYIDELRLKYPNLLVFLTGGHTNYFAKRLKNIIFANINLVLVGLNRILEYNVENKESSSS